jgi:hypothetical protein
MFLTTFSDNGGSVYYSYGSQKSKKQTRPASGATKRPKTANKKVSSSAEVQNKDSQVSYPSSRGLVKSSQRFA